MAQSEAVPDTEQAKEPGENNLQQGPPTQDTPSEDVKKAGALFDKKSTSLELGSNFKFVIPSRYFEWPEERENTEKQIRQLKEKQILFMVGYSSAWWNLALTRFASVLHSSLNRLWPECEGVKANTTNDKSQNTIFGFWKNLKQAKPVIIYVSENNADEYIQTLLQIGWNAVLSVIEELKEKNIFLLIPTKDQALFQTLLDKDKREGFSDLSYGRWEIPSIRLELNKHKNSASAEIFNSLQARFGENSLSEQAVYYLIHDNPSLSPENLLKLIEEEGQISNRASTLLESALEDESELKIRILYAATFFHEVTLADFESILFILLNNKSVIEKTADNKSDSQSLYSIWSNPIRQFKTMKHCSLTVRETDNTNVISFSEKVDYPEMRRTFLHKNFYPVFFSLTKELLETDLLFLEPSDSRSPSLLKLFATLIKTNSATYDGRWLFKKAIEQATILYSSISVKDLNEIENEHDIDVLKKYLEPLNGLLKELLLLNQEQLKKNVSQFFQSLISSKLKKNTVLELATDLYLDLQNTGNFPEKQLDDYFIQCLEEDLQNGFVAYYTLIRNFPPFELHQKTQVWLADESKKDSNTKLFSWLYKLDYCITTFYSYRSGEEDYEFLTITDKTELIDVFENYLKEILSSGCLDALGELLQNGYSRRIRFVSLELSITGLYLNLTPEQSESVSFLALIGEIIANWFYILSEHPGTGEGTRTWMDAYTFMLRLRIPNRQLSEMRIFWKMKVAGIYTQNILRLKSSDNNHPDIEVLKKRRTSLETLIASTTI